jgi:hypothetical protein
MAPSRPFAEGTRYSHELLSATLARGWLDADRETLQLERSINLSIDIDFRACWPVAMCQANCLSL